MKYIIKFGIADPYYIAKWDGDPGRTYSQGSAKRFATKESADAAAKRIIRKYPQRYDETAHYEVERIGESS